MKTVTYNVKDKKASAKIEGITKKKKKKAISLAKIYMNSDVFDKVIVQSSDGKVEKSFTFKF